MKRQSYRERLDAIQRHRRIGGALAFVACSLLGVALYLALAWTEVLHRESRSARHAPAVAAAAYENRVESWHAALVAGSAGAGILAVRGVLVARWRRRDEDD